MTRRRSGNSTFVAKDTSFVLVYGNLRTGGIETLIVRMATYLAKNGRVVVVCCGEGGLVNALPGAANVVTYVDTRELCRKFRDVVASRFADGADTIIISFDPISAARGLHVEHQCSLRGRVTHLSGVFHPRAYFMNGERKDRIALNQCVAQAVGYDHLFFMNEECRRAHAKRWNVDLRGSAIATLPVDMCEDAWAPESSGRLRIVSVGRLVEFKAYNVEAPKMAALLRDAGLLVTWDIYGDGPLGAEIRNEIERQGVGDSVRLLGELPYRDFQKTVVGYDLFIGMGTAALESAMVGVPTICATDGERERCYGFLHELPYGNVGEVQLEPPRVSILSLLTAFAHAEHSDRKRISQLCRAAAMRYEMGEFLDVLVSAHHAEPGTSAGLMKLVVRWVYSLATESFVARQLRRIVRRGL